MANQQTTTTKTRYLHITDKRYEDEKLINRYAVIGLGIGLLLGICTGTRWGIIGGGIIGLIFANFVGWIVSLWSK